MKISCWLSFPSTKALNGRTLDKIQPFGDMLHHTRLSRNAVQGEDSA